MLLELTTEERDLLVRLLNRALENLKSEIYATERYEWRKEMQEDEERLKAVLGRLQGAATM